ncbi:cytochrome c [Bradyrhizobium sp.]|uniref:c-type cytochrome n=1 Tax=Bradyrhizobium sp. TaxID=376 RepID=UPI0025BDEDC5|nr:cytochrome c [Bradyrhizobium sp.]
MRQRGSRQHASVGSAVLVGLLSLLPASAVTQDDGSSWRDRTFSSGYRFVEMSGEELFASVCQGCHMVDASGAAGAGTYPSLAGNPRLESGDYPIDLVLNGRRGMPPFADMMSDGQVAAVVNYVRTHFGNGYPDAVTAKDVRAARR